MKSMRDPAMTNPKGEAMTAEEQKIEKVGSYTGLTEDQVKRFVGCLLAVGLEIVESQPAPATAPHPIFDGRFAAVFADPKMDDDYQPAPATDAQEACHHKILTNFCILCRKTVRYPATPSDFEEWWNYYTAIPVHKRAPLSRIREVAEAAWNASHPTFAREGGDELVIYASDCIWKRGTKVFDPLSDNHLGCVVNSQTKPKGAKVYSRAAEKQWKSCPVDCMLTRDAEAWIADRASHPTFAWPEPSVDVAGLETYIRVYPQHNEVNQMATELLAYRRERERLEGK